MTEQAASVPTISLQRDIGATLRYGTRSSIPLIAANAVGVGTQIVTAMLFTRLLSPSDYGRYSFVWAAMAVLSVVSLPGIALSTARAASLGDDGALTDGTRVRLKWGVAGAVPLALAAALFAFKGDNELALAFAVASALFAPYNALETYSSYLAGKGDFGRQAAWRIASLIATAGAAGLALSISPRVDAVLLATLGAAVAVSAAAYFRTTSAASATRVDGSSDAIRYGKRLSALNILSTVESRIDGLLVGGALSFAALAQFRLAETVVDATAKRAWIVLSQPFFPRWARARPEDAGPRWRTDMLVQIAILAIAYALLLLLLPTLVPLLFTDTYKHAVPIAQILVVASFAGLPGAGAELFFLARKREAPQWALRATTISVHLGLLPLTLPLWGATGAAVAVLVSRAAYSVVAAVFAIRVVRRSGAG